ncbi:MAG TPA: mechanosensitive ion channel domain-containing protein [Methylomirabilota bacterium]|nr:mechanosensitive ion channel domain-containing protein [Methylomirabilota bacterium]
MQKTIAIMLVLLLGATVYGIIRTAEPPEVAPSVGKGKTAVASEEPLVDQTPLKTAQQFAQQVTTADERPLALEALRLADYEVDLAYDAALRNAQEHPPALSADAKEAKDRLQKAQKLMADDDARMAALKEVIAKTRDEDRKEKLQEQLDAVDADRDLASDEADDAQQDFRREGGDLAARIQEAQKQHEEVQRGTPAIPQTVVETTPQFGLIHLYEQWNKLHSLQLQLWRAKQDAENVAVALALKHNSLDANLEKEKEKAPELAHHSKRKKTGSAPNTAAESDQRSAEEIAAAADRTWHLASEQEALANYDKRVETNKELAAIYGSWIDNVAGRQRLIVHQALTGILVILGILIAGVYTSTIMDKVVNRLSMDRRQLQSLHTVTHVGVRIVALLLILLVIMGPPGQLGTFLGLAGAGLTVALKDFIVGFLGWFVLMGKNGIRLGDWVEIKGVTGEVVQIGPFHTVLLETGNWTDSGHPTGRRVTFTNSFAIEGHYFNFSTSGQWLWDELQLVLPYGEDPYPVIEEFQKKVIEATKESGARAEEEWRRATRSREMSSFSVAPAISVKPVVGGIELSVRYITRANERYQLRANLYQAAVEMLGRKPPSVEHAPAQE